MTSLYYSISEEVFASYPGYVRGVVLAYDVTNRESPKELVELLRAAENQLRLQVTVETIADHPRIHAWREAYRQFGAKPSEFRSSIEAMARRVLRNEPLPSINALVDIGNICSLHHLVNVGGHAIDVVKKDITLRPASGTENFIPFGSVSVEHPLRGEIIFVEGDTVLTRRWTWRQANHTLTEVSTKDIEFNIDGLPPVKRSDIELICQEVIALVEKYCGGKTSCAILTQDSPRIRIK